MSVIVAVLILGVAASGLCLQGEAILKGGWTVGGRPPTAAGPMGPSIAVCAPPRDRTHLLLLRLHRGDFFGPFGVWIDIFCGLALGVLSVTGLWVYVDMLRRRFSLGRKAFFW